MCNCVEVLRKSLAKELNSDVIKFECTPAKLATMEHYFGIRFSYSEKGRMKRSFIKPNFCPICGEKLGE